MRVTLNPQVLYIRGTGKREEFAFEITLVNTTSTVSFVVVGGGGGGGCGGVVGVVVIFH